MILVTAASLAETTDRERRTEKEGKTRLNQTCDLEEVAIMDSYVIPCMHRPSFPCSRPPFLHHFPSWFDFPIL